jgi:alpha-mannosidase
MTSPQWFETLERPFTSTSFVDLRDGSGGGLLIAHDGSGQWFRDDEGVRVVLTAYDPWDEGRYSGNGRAGCRFRIFAHKGLNHAERVQRAAALAADASAFATNADAEPVGGGTAYGVEQDIPAAFGALEVCNAPGVLAHAFHRESMKSGEHLPDWAGHRMAAESGGACTHPYVVRLVEWNGEPAEVTLKLPGPIALAAKTNLMGEVGPQVAAGEDTAWLAVEPADPPDWAAGAKLKGEPIAWSQVRFRMRPREIATVMADLVMGRKQFRDLDAKREVWATVHKTE